MTKEEAKELLPIVKALAEGKKKVEGYGKLAPVSLEGAKFALSNQWISVKDDLPCNHEELMVKDEKGRWETKRVLVRIQETDTSFKRPYFADCMMSKWDGEESGFLWHLCSQGYITHWMPIPEPPKE